MKSHYEIAVNIVNGCREVDRAGSFVGCCQFVENLLLENYGPQLGMSFQAAPNAPTCPHCYDGIGKPSKAKPGAWLCQSCGLHFVVKD